MGKWDFLPEFPWLFLCFLKQDCQNYIRSPSFLGGELWENEFFHQNSFDFSHVFWSKTLKIISVPPPFLGGKLRENEVFYQNSFDFSYVFWNKTLKIISAPPPFLGGELWENEAFYQNSSFSIAFRPWMKGEPVWLKLLQRFGVQKYRKSQIIFEEIPHFQSLSAHEWGGNQFGWSFFKDLLCKNIHYFWMGRRRHFGVGFWSS